jgi:hypothetical protein
VSIGPGGAGAPSGTLAARDDGPSATAGGSRADITPDTDLAALADRVGQRVRVGGLIARLADDGFDLDDGTALARVQLVGEMADLLPHLREGEAVAATGLVAMVDGAPAVVVDGDGTLVRVGSLGQALPIGGQELAPEVPASGDPAAEALSADSTGLAPGLAPTSLLAMALLTALSVLGTLVRRRLVRRRLRTVLVERLAGLRRREGGGAG